MPDATTPVRGNYWASARRFAPKPGSEPVPETPEVEPVVQEPMDGDDRSLSSTTRRFRVWIGDVQLRDAVEPHAFAKAWADFGIVEPTVLDLREALSSRFGPGQVRVVQLKRVDVDPETDDPAEVRDGVGWLDPYAGLDVDDLAALPPETMPEATMAEERQYVD